MSSIEVKSLHKEYKFHEAVKGVSLTIEKGHIYGLLGRNGAGKTTLINLICNREFPTKGQVLLDGKDVMENDAALKHIYCMGEQDLLPKYMKVSDTIKSMKFFYKNTDEDYALKLCSEFGIDPKKKLSQLSTGSRTLAKVILAMASGADFIFLDEPVLGVDANHREMLYKLILERLEETEAAFVISTHLIDECAALFERCFVLKNGELIADEDSEDLRASAYLVEGKTADVNEYVKDKEYLSKNVIGSLCCACLMGEPENVPDTLEVSHPALQQLLIAMTGGEENA